MAIFIPIFKEVPIFKGKLLGSPLHCLEMFDFFYFILLSEWILMGLAKFFFFFFFHVRLHVHRRFKTSPG